jgi:flagellar protein FliO/FliZ
MQWFSSLPLGDNWKVQAVVFLAVAVVAIIALTVAYRALFGHRLRVPGGGRARQSRLGLVDAFSLDGQRQLVLVRRDNVEHLVMIGGLNDVVIESQIVRAQTQALPPREKEVAPPQPPAATPRIVSATPSPPPPPPLPLAAAAGTPPRPQTRPEPPNIAAQTRSAPKPSDHIGPKPAGPTGQPAPAPKPALAPAKTSSLPPPIVTPLPPPPQPKPVVAPAAGQTPDSAPKPVPPPKAPTPAAVAIKGDSFAGLDTLEAEMAKLLGRKS